VWPGSRTLRFRMAGLFLAVFGIIQTLVCAVIFVSRERDLREEFDARLLDRAEVIVDEVAARLEQARSTAPEGGQRRRINPFRFPGYHFQLRRADGVIFERSPSLGKAELPLADAGLTSKHQRLVFEDIKEPLAGEPGRSGVELRMLTVHRSAPGEEGFILQIAASTEHLRRAIQRLRRLLLIAVPVGLLMAGLASWLLAGRALAPLVRVAGVANRLEAADLSLRFEHSRRGDEVADVVESLNRMLDRLSVGFASQERFISDVAHELKTPLAVLLSKAQVFLQKERSPEEHARFVADVQDEVRALAQTMDSLLALARAEAGLPRGAVTEVSINDVVMDAVSRCAPLAAQQEVRLVPQLAVPGDDLAAPSVLGDAPMLTVMLANLVRNAVRHSPPDQPLDVTVRLGQRAVAVAVRDRGPGIPEEHLDRIFDRFFRVPDPTASFQGTGLGLTIARGVARLHGGDIRVANHPEGGCEFTVHLPAAASEPRQTD
jgi:two-component system OmpR family sensor kinase